MKIKKRVMKRESKGRAPAGVGCIAVAGPERRHGHGHESGSSEAKRRFRDRSTSMMEEVRGEISLVERRDGHRAGGEPRWC
jgi:hypothetical protein